MRDLRPGGTVRKLGLEPNLLKVHAFSYYTMLLEGFEHRNDVI